mmetsp:Transcript_7157/g.27392  ORF Transcript_7157/g.27392 Transcript_7157/m.27392 type:complete len:266 (-) Transcript_7157:2022-2819(-)
MLMLSKRIACAMMRLMSSAAKSVMRVLRESYTEPVLCRSFIRAARSRAAVAFPSVSSTAAASSGSSDRSAATSSGSFCRTFCTCVRSARSRISRLTNDSEHERIQATAGKSSARGRAAFGPGACRTAENSFQNGQLRLVLPTWNAKSPDKASTAVGDRTGTCWLTLQIAEARSGAIFTSSMSRCSVTPPSLASFARHMLRRTRWMQPLLSGPLQPWVCWPTCRGLGSVSRMPNMLLRIPAHTASLNVLSTGASSSSRSSVSSSPS